MSIKLFESPFKSLESPCCYARESMNCIVCSCKDAKVTSCNLYHQTDCEFYKEADPEVFVDNRRNSTVTRWIRVEDDVCYRYICSHCHEEPPLTSYKAEWHSNHCPSCGRYMYSDEEAITDIPTGTYQHYKGKHYEVLGVAEHSECSEKLVVYKALYGKYQMYVRPLKMFIEDIEDVKYNYRGPRFYPLKDCIMEGLRKNETADW